MIEISIVIPCLNEVKTLRPCIEQALSTMKKSGISGEVIVADNGSTDGSQDLARQAGAKVVDVPLRGYGAALYAGFEAAQGKFLLMGDADQSYDFGEIPRYLAKLREGADMVMGCRLPKGGGTIMPNAMPWHHRWIGNPVLSTLGRIFFPSRITDFHCGMRALTKDAFRRMDLQTTGMEFASEMVIKATLKKLKIAEIPITLYKDARDRPPHLRSFRDGWRHLRFMLLFSPRWLFWYPGLFLYFFGLAGGIILLSGVSQIGPVNVGINSLLACSAFVITGFNIITFALYARYYSVLAGFLPKPAHFDRIFAFFNLERGLVFGFTVFLLGLGLLLRGFLQWKGSHFTYLSYPSSLKFIIPGITSFILGIEICFSSFYLSFLSIPKKQVP